MGKVKKKAAVNATGEGYQYALQVAKDFSKSIDVFIQGSFSVAPECNRSGDTAKG